jgi:hypothetical protein
MKGSDSKLVSFELYEHYLLIKGHGLRDSAQAMDEASKAIYKKVESLQAQRLLVDYREVKITLPLSAAFNLIRNYDSAMPFLKDSVAAVVFSEDGLTFGRYWCEVGNLRGYRIKIFQSLADAESWLMSEDKEL